MFKETPAETSAERVWLLVSEEGLRMDYLDRQLDWIKMYPDINEAHISERVN